MKALIKIANTFEESVSNLTTHATTNPKKPVSRLRAGIRGGIHGAIVGGGLGYAASHAEDAYNSRGLSAYGFKPALVTPKHKLYSAIGGSVGAARGVYRGMRGLGPVRGTRIRVHGLGE